MSTVEYVAGSEDEPILWFRAPSRRTARRAAASEFYVKPWRITVAPRHMRAATCPDHPDGEYGRTPGMSDIEADRLVDDPPETCRCYQVEEGWMGVCGPEWPDASAVWQCEPRGAPAWWWKVRRRLRRTHPRGYGQRGASRPVLWGGKLTRRSRWYDRLLLGRGVLYLPGDVQLKPGMSELRHCAVCDATTPHQPPRRVTTGDFGAHNWLCLATGHHDRVWALL